MSDCNLPTADEFMQILENTGVTTKEGAILWANLLGMRPRHYRGIEKVIYIHVADEGGAERYYYMEFSKDRIFIPDVHAGYEVQHVAK